MGHCSGFPLAYYTTRLIHHHRVVPPVLVHDPHLLPDPRLRQGEVELPEAPLLPAVLGGRLTAAEIDLDGENAKINVWEIYAFTTYTYLVFVLYGPSFYDLYRQVWHFVSLAHLTLLRDEDPGGVGLVRDARDLSPDHVDHGAVREVFFFDR